MAQIYSSVNSGNWSNAASWGKVTNTPTIHATTNLNVTTGSFYSATFTAPSVVDQCVGCWIYITVKAATNPIVTVTLQDNSVDTTATATYDTANLASGNCWIYFKFAVPYTFANLTAGRYRFKLTTNSSTISTFAADGGGSNFHYYAVDSRTGVPTSTDKVLIGSNASLTIDIDGTQNIGNGGTTLNTPKNVQDAVKVLNFGILNHSVSADSILNCNGCFQVYYGGEYKAGTSLVPFPVAYLAKLVFTPAASGDYGISLNSGGKFKLYGATNTYWKTTYSSGSGTTASPLIVADSTDWAINDQIIIATTSGINETEYKFIKTIAGTSITLSDTAGGGESGLAYAHNAGCYILKINKNVLITTNNTTLGWYQRSQSNIIVGNYVLNNVRLEQCGSTTSNKYYVAMLTTTNTKADLSDVVFYNITGDDSIYFNLSKTVETYNRLICCNATLAAGRKGLNTANIANKTFNDCFVLDVRGAGWTLDAANCIFNRCVGVASGKGSTVGNFTINNCPGSKFYDCESHVCQNAFIFSTSGDGGEWYDLLCGSKGVNLIQDISCGTAYSKISFFNPTFANYGSSSFIGTTYLNMVSSSEVRLHQINGTANQHEIYTPSGIIYATGAGLTDTTVRTANTLNVKIMPEDSDAGLSWQFKVLAKANTAVSCLGFIKKNANMIGSEIKVELFLPGSSVADASQIMTDDGNWNVFNLFANYEESINNFARIVVTGKSLTSLAAFYVADIFNGTNDITNLKTWYNAIPSDIMFEQLGDAAAVWAISTASQSTGGTMGKLLNDAALDIDGLQIDTATIISNVNLLPELSDIEASTVIAKQSTLNKVLSAINDAIAFILKII